MRKSAWLYIFIIMGAAIWVSMLTLRMPRTQETHWWLFVFAVAVATALRLYRVETANHQAYEGSTIALFAAVMLFSPPIFIMLVLIAHTIEWVVAVMRIQGTHLRAWYIQPFNIAKSILSAMLIYWLLANFPLAPLRAFEVRDLLLVILSSVSYVAANQLMLGIALYLARGISFYQAGIVRDGFVIEIPLTIMGFMVVLFLDYNPILVFLVFAPIVLIYQAFMLPKLNQEAIRQLEQFNGELTIANQSIKQINDELFLTLAKLFDARDPYVGGHAAQVAAYAVAIGAELGLPTGQLETLRQAGYLHDIGKIAIPEAILHKPGKLTEEEYELMKQHTTIGADFIATSQYLRHLAPFIRHHHERWDGRGYPEGLTGTAIPLEARILNICDSVEAMASDRSYHRALSTDQIIAEVQRCTGSQFDPTVAYAFIRIAMRERNHFVINSARKVISQRTESIQIGPAINLKRLAEIYGLEPA